MADKFRPTGGLVYAALEFMDTFVQAEMLLESLHNVIYAIAIVESALFIFVFFIFLRKPKSFYFVAMHIPHAIQIMMGIMLNRKLPNSFAFLSLLKPTYGN